MILRLSFLALPLALFAPARRGVAGPCRPRFLVLAATRFRGEDPNSWSLRRRKSERLSLSRDTTKFSGCRRTEEARRGYHCGLTRRIPWDYGNRAYPSRIPQHAAGHHSGEWLVAANRRTERAVLCADSRAATPQNFRALLV